MNAPQPPPFRHVLVELFAAANLGFLGLDIVLAHSVNDFAHAAEWGRSRNLQEVASTLGAHARGAPVQAEETR